MKACNIRLYSLCGRISIISNTAPIVKGYFVVPTESMFFVAEKDVLSLLNFPVFNDSGCPHTLEQ